MKRQLGSRFAGLLFIAIFNMACTNALGVTLVDYGASAASTTFGLTGWNTVIKSTNIGYTSLGNGGLLLTTEAEEYNEYRGISGVARAFTVVERIVVTWYNNSDESVRFTSRISFTDNNEPDPEAVNNKWYTMRSYNDYRETYTEINSYSTGRTVFNITDSGVHKTNASYSLVNINLAIEWGSTYQKQFLICEKIELLSDADIIAPAQPTGLAANVLSDSKIHLAWNQPTDNVQTVEYLIYMNGAIEGYSRTSDHTCVLLEPGSNYTFAVSALDAAGNESIQSASVQAATQEFKGPHSVINPSGFEYLGAIALPEDFSWGGEAIAYNCDGGQTGSLFVTNVNQYENGLVGEVILPEPVISTQKNVDDLNVAAMLHQPVNIRPANINSWDFVDIWRTGLEYIPEEGRLYSSWSIHYTVTEGKNASISCCNAADLSAGTKYGAWYVGNAGEPPLDAMMNDWLFSLPKSWADAHCSGRNIVTGRCRDGGLSGLGPTLYAIAPVGATPPAANSELAFTTLLEYGPGTATDNYHFPNSIDGYKLNDDWREAIWLNAGTQTAVAIAGKKGLGHNWYGYNGEWMQFNWVIADVPHPEAEFYTTDPNGKGWRSHNYQPMILFFDPTDLAKVGDGLMNAWEPQPYAALRIPKNLFFGSFAEIFSAAFDFEKSILYIAEMVAELDGRIVLHAWKVNPVTTFIGSQEHNPGEFTLYQNYPNPFNSETLIQYRLSSPSQISLIVYNSAGQQVRKLLSSRENTGLHHIQWDGKDNAGNDVPSGLYFSSLRTDKFEQTQKMLLLK
ncbi:MAG TPA: FlgD immunoglobulin-like domain containing protein [bacterium]|nr:FlgD immunoglobulin-like domain containing protein [bacterium]HPN44075.1 FlgD immunoglobulin-like domain containing protein [bacterium]